MREIIVFCGKLQFEIFEMCWFWTNALDYYVKNIINQTITI